MRHLDLITRWVQPSALPHRFDHLAEEGNIRSHDGLCRVFDAAANANFLL
jgi:hypothetical protein